VAMLLILHCRRRRHCNRVQQLLPIGNDVGDNDHWPEAKK